MSKILLQLLARYGPKVLKFLGKKGKTVQKASQSNKFLNKITPQFKRRLSREGISQSRYSKLHNFDKMAIKDKLDFKYRWIDAKKATLKKDPTFYDRPSKVGKNEYKSLLEMVRRGMGQS